MEPYQIPEILRLPLEELCLRILIYGFPSPEVLLAQAIDPPPPKNIERALLTLSRVGAISSSTKQLNPLGIHLAHLPLDVRLGKMVIYGSIFKCLDPMLTIVASLGLGKSIFSQSFGKEDESLALRRDFFGLGTGNSDLLTTVKAYENWRRRISSSTSGGVYDFCRKHFLNHSNLLLVEELKLQIMRNLLNMGFLTESDVNWKDESGFYTSK